MKISLTLDYELFFGPVSGTPEKSLFEPVKALDGILSRNDIKATFFIDAGYLCRLKDYAGKYHALDKEFSAVRGHLNALVRDGHEIGLHVHPHWERSVYTGHTWKHDLSVYRLGAFGEHEAAEIIRAYTSLLKEHTERVVSFRAGGWCIQPFSQIRTPLMENGIKVDSTVFYGGYRSGHTHSFDFRSAPRRSRWHFQDDPLSACDNGIFYEIPISSFRVSPIFYILMTGQRKLSSAYSFYGDGKGITQSGRDKLSRLMSFSYVPVSIDGYYSVLLERAYNRCRSATGDDDSFVIIGHPKLFTGKSLKNFAAFIANRKKDCFLRLNDYIA